MWDLTSDILQKNRMASEGKMLGPLYSIWFCGPFNTECKALSIRNQRGFAESIKYISGKSQTKNC